MCGINGYISPEGNISRMNQLVSHRGPDYAGTWQSGNVAIGHCLLAIREAADLSHQPVVKRGSPWVLAFNGQLYNTTQIKKELGETHSTASLDTTLLYALIQKHGWGFVRYIHGMYAIALYNSDTRELRLYRDPSGQKVLYYYNKGGNFIFSSELKSLLSHPYVPHKLSAQAVSIAADIGYLPGNFTIVENVYKLMPGEILIVNTSTGAHRSEWLTSNEEDYFFGHNADSVIAQTVKEHLQSRAHISINLSGGIDSSILLHEVVQAGRTVEAFSTEFEEASEKFNRDSVLARQLAHDYQCNFYPVSISKQSYLENLFAAYATVEEPNYNISLPVYFQMAKHEGRDGAKLRVVLSGDGGDEVFGGYPHYEKARRIARYKRLFGTYGVNTLKQWREGKGIDYGSIPSQWWGRRKLRRRWINIPAMPHETIEYLSQQFLPFQQAYGKKHDDVYLMMLMDRVIWLAGENFIRSDKLFMSQSMEMRCPFAYQPLRAYFDSHLRSREYISATQNKIFLRSLYDKKLPEYITHRPDKTGWRAPLTEWYDSTFRKSFLEIISAAQDRDRIVDWESVTHIIAQNDHWPGKEVHFYLSLAAVITSLGLTD